MRSEMVVVVCEQHKLLPDAPPTAYPRIMEAVGSHLKRVKPFFDGFSVGIVDPTA
jgi:hypothetical protein